MKRLYVIFDATCAFCLECRNWLRRQPAFVELAFIPLQSPKLERLFPGIGKFAGADELLAISDEGEVYNGADAWLVCLHALQDYREWAQRLAHPALRPFARRAFEMLSHNRFALSRWMARQSREELREHLAARAERSCKGGKSCAP